MNDKQHEETKRFHNLILVWATLVIVFAFVGFVGLMSKGTDTPAPEATPTTTIRPRLATLIAWQEETKMPTSTKPPALTAEDIIPKGYYNSTCLIPKGVSLNSYLTEYEWVDPYQEDSWDCSQMSANIEWLVENCGYKANIVITSSQADVQHSWVEIKIGSKWRPYEATGGSFYFWPEILQEIYAGNTITFEDIYGVYDFFMKRSSDPSFVILARNQFLREWAWWEKDPGRD